MIRINTYEQTIPVEKKKLKLKPQVKEFFENVLTIMIILTLVVGLVLVVFEMIDRHKNVEAFHNAETTEIYVDKGETIWTIAERLDFKDVAIGDIVYKIQELNDIHDSKIYAGQALIVPVPFE